MTRGPRPGKLELLGLVAGELDPLLAVPDAEQVAAKADQYFGRQPAQTAIVPAHRFESDTTRQWGQQALAALDEFAPGTAEFAHAMGLDSELAQEVRPLVAAKLAREPVEDLRIDFADGYGVRGDKTEDAHARAAARSLAVAMRDDVAPTAAGVRCKSLESAPRRRAVATLDAFLGALTENGRPFPPWLMITLPRVTSSAQVTAMAVLCERLESAYGARFLERIWFEIQVQAPQMLISADGGAAIVRCLQAGRGRLIGLHFDAYDYCASLGIAPRNQGPEHPAADHARAVMQVAAAGTGVGLSDGPLDEVPVGGRDEVIASWRRHARLVRRSLERGVYQGWDLHPRQLVSRYAATYGFYREGQHEVCDRLKVYAKRAASGLEDPATARSLAAYLLRGVYCGAFSEAEVVDATGLDTMRLRGVLRRGRVPSLP